jgi:hypothetical protein
MQLPPSKWAAALQQAYAQARMPTIHNASQSPRAAKSGDTTLSRTVVRIVVELFAALTPYLILAWVIVAFDATLPFGIALSAILVARFFFAVLDRISATLVWVFGGRANSINWWLRFLRQNNLPTHRAVPRDSIDNYLYRIQNDTTMSTDVRLSAKEIATLLESEDIGMLTRIRRRAAAQAALEQHAHGSKSDSSSH